MTPDPPDTDLVADETETLKLVGFRIEDWRLAVRLDQVQTSIMPPPVTRVFHVPDYIKGIINLRGTIVGVLDLGRLLGLARSGGGHLRYLVVKSGGVQAAIPVHEVFRLPDVPLSLVAPLPSSVSPNQKQYLEGIINTSNLPGWSAAGEETVTLIDVTTLFDSPAIRALRGGA